MKLSLREKLWGAFLLFAVLSGLTLLLGGKPLADFISTIIARIGW